MGAAEVDTFQHRVVPRRESLGDRDGARVADVVEAFSTALPRSALAIAAAPSGLFSLRSIFFSTSLPRSASAIATPPSGPMSFQL